MIVVGACAVEDDASDLEVVVRHHLAAVCDRIVVALDPASSPVAAGTLKALVREGLPVAVETQTGPVGRGAALSALARAAHADGVDWVVPLESGTLWTDRQGQPLRPVLSSAAPGEVRAAVVTIAQDRSVRTDSTDSLLKARWHVPGDAGTRSAFRPTDHVTVADDGSVTGAKGWSQSLDWIVCLHLPVASAEVLDRRRSHARQDGGDPTWADLTDDDLEARWQAVSVADGHVDGPDGPVRAQSDVRWASAVWRALQEPA